MWRTIVPEILGEKPSGVLWQREQFCWKIRSPSSSCCCEDFAATGFFVDCATSDCFCVPDCAIAHDETRTIKPKSKCSDLKIIFLSKPGRESGRQFLSARYWSRRWRRTAANSSLEFECCEEGCSRGRSRRAWCLQTEPRRWRHY